MGIVEILLIVLSLFNVLVVPGLLIAIIYILRGIRQNSNDGLEENGSGQH